MVGEYAGAVTTVVTRVTNFFRAQGQLLGMEEQQEVIEIRGMLKAGFLNMNPVVVTVWITKLTADRTSIRIQGTAKEGLIKQRAGPRKHMSRFKRKGLERSAPLIEELKRIASAHDATPSQIALSWLLRFHGSTVVAIPGAYSAEQARENAGAMKLELSREELDRIHEVSKSD